MSVVYKTVLSWAYVTQALYIVFTSSDTEWIEHQRSVPLLSAREPLRVRSDQEQAFQKSQNSETRVHHVHSLHSQVKGSHWKFFVVLLCVVYDN